MINAIKRIYKGVKQKMNDNIQACKEVLSNAQNRLVLGLVILGVGVGLGGGLIASAYIHV